MIDVDAGANEIERLALTIFEAMEDGTIGDAIGELCTDDFRWENSGLPTVVGAEGYRALGAAGGFAQHVPILKGMRSFSADLVHIASVGDMSSGTVFTERIDHHWDADGRDLMTPHICGVIEIRDGKITRLADFYDVVCYEQEPTDPNPAHASR